AAERPQLRDGVRAGTIGLLGVDLVDDPLDLLTGAGRREIRDLAPPTAGAAVLQRPLIVLAVAAGPDHPCCAGHSCSQVGNICAPGSLSSPPVGLESPVLVVMRWGDATSLIAVASPDCDVDPKGCCVGARLAQPSPRRARRERLPAARGISVARELSARARRSTRR